MSGLTHFVQLVSIRTSESSVARQLRERIRLHSWQYNPKVNCEFGHLVCLGALQDCWSPNEKASEHRMWLSWDGLAMLQKSQKCPNIQLQILFQSQAMLALALRSWYKDYIRTIALHALEAVHYLPDFIKWNDPRPTWQHWLFERGCTNASLLSIQRETIEFASSWTWYSKSRTESRRQNNPELQNHHACRKMSICSQEQITTIFRVISPRPLQRLFCPKKNQLLLYHVVKEI